LEHSVSQQFLKKAHREMFDENPDGLLEQFESYKAPIEPKWISAN
jgi:ribosomal protein S17E